jgi:hypothetical protein
MSGAASSSMTAGLKFRVPELGEPPSNNGLVMLDRYQSSFLSADVMAPRREALSKKTASTGAT